MGTNCAPLLQICFCFVMRETSMLSHSDNTQADIIKAFHSTSR